MTDELNKAANNLDPEKLNKLLDKSADLLDAAAKKKKNDGFFKSGRFLQSLMIFVAFLGLLFHWQEQINQEKITQINMHITKLEQLKSNEDKAIMAARILIINQHQLCPTSNRHVLTMMKIARNNSLTNVASFNGVQLNNADQVKKTIAAVVSKVFNLSAKQICTINSSTFDHSLYKKLVMVNSEINSNISKSESEIRKDENSLSL